MWAEMDKAARTAAIQPLLIDGKSASEIALALGVGSRSAVLGHIYRNRLENPQARGSFDQQRAKARDVQRGRRQRAQERASEQARERAVKATARPVVVTPDTLPHPVNRKEAWLALPGSNPRPLHELGSSDCRWPIGDPFAVAPAIFCGCDTADGQSFCEAHRRIAYVPASALVLKKKRAA